jgi:hypothetical protein
MSWAAAAWRRTKWRGAATRQRHCTWRWCDVWWVGEGDVEREERLEE